MTTERRVRGAWLGLALLASLEASADAADRSSREPVALRAPGPLAIYLRPLTFDMGSGEQELLAALVRCKREPLPDACNEGTFASEAPPHRESVTGFWMSRTEVTVAQYQRCVAASRCTPPAYEGGARRFARPSWPVTLVTFDDAERYCSFRGGRLPTEAEFERAARGATRRIYPWGQSYHGKLANHGRLGIDPTDNQDGFTELAPVGSFPDGATPEGILDLAGNAAEWTGDAYRPDYASPASHERAVRGGSFASGAAFLRGAARSGRAPETREPTLGFRCVWPVKPLRD